MKKISCINLNITKVNLSTDTPVAAVTVVIVQYKSIIEAYMTRNIFKFSIQMLLLLVLTLSLSACEDDFVRSDRSVHHDNYYHYHYYPDIRVYYDTRRGFYFYYTNTGWTKSRYPPKRFHLRRHSYQKLRIRHANPYLRHGRSNKRSKRHRKHRGHRNDNYDRRRHGGGYQ